MEARSALAQGEALPERSGGCRGMIGHERVGQPAEERAACTGGLGFMSRWGLLRLALVAAVVGTQGVAALACDCPKQYVAKRDGTMSEIQPALPLPPPLPPAKLAVAKTG